MTKTYLFLLLFFISSFAFGQGDAPPMYQGDAGTAKRVGATAVLPNNQVTKLSSSKVRLETGNKNILTNASNEAFDPGEGWNVGLTDGSPLDDGLKSGCRTYTNSPVSIYQDSPLFQNAFSSGKFPGVARATITKSNSGQFYICPRKAGVRVDITQCTPYENTNTAQRKEAPFILGGTSNGVEITTNGVNFNGIVCIDNSYVANEDVRQAVSPIGTWTNGTCTATWTTNTSVACKYRQVGTDLEVQYLLTLSGAPNATGLYFGLPSGFTMDTTKVMSTSTNAASYGSGSLRDASSNAFVGLSAYIAGPTQIGAYYHFNGAIPPTASSSSSVLSEITATLPIVWATGDTVSVTVKVPVTQFNGSTSVYSATNLDTDWASYAPTIAGLGTGSVSSVTGKWKRNGGNIDVSVRFIKDASAGSGSTPVTISLPSGITVDATRMVAAGASIGTAWTNTGTPAASNLASYADSTTNTIKILTGVGDVIGSSVTATGTWEVFTTFPVTGWTQSNVIFGSFAEMKAVAVRAVQSSSQSIPTSTITAITFDATKTYDTHSAFNTATGVFTAPEDGYYSVKASILFNTAAWTAGAFYQLILYKNGSQHSSLDRKEVESSRTGYYSLSGSDDVFLLKNQTLSLHVTQARGSATSLINDAAFNYISIAKHGAGTP